MSKPAGFNMFGKRAAQLKCQVLLVDAAPVDIRATRGALEGSRPPFGVDVARDVETVVEKLKSKRYDCLLVDPDILKGTGWKLDEVLAMAGPEAAIVVLCHTARPGLPPGLTGSACSTFLDIEALRSPGLADKVKESLEVVRALREGQVDALLVPGAGTTLPLLAPGTDSVYRILVETLQEGIVTVDSEGYILFTNRRTAEILGCDPDSILGQSILALVDGEDRPLLRDKMEEALRGWTSRCELTLTGPGQPSVYVLVSLSPVGEVGDRATGACLALTDLSEEKRLRDELQRLASTDALTGLYNRRYLFEYLDKECRRARRYSRPLSCLMIDIDDFKVCNDLYGHLAGDAVLRQIAALIKDSAREVDIVARYGGEEFCVLLPETPHAGAMRVAERVQRAIAKQRLVVGEQSVSITVSIGVFSPSHNDELQPDVIVGFADAALREAKAAGKNRVRGQPMSSPVPGQEGLLPNQT